MTGWSIKNILEDKELLQAAKNEWIIATKNHPHLDLLCSKEDLDKEVEWFERKLTEFLNNHVKITQITAYSKRWWNHDVAEARKTWARDKKRLSRDQDLKEELKQAHNKYYRTIRKAKRICWQDFLQGKGNKTELPGMILDKNHCWTAFKYTKPLQFRTTPALKDTEGNIAITIKAKQALVCKSAFPKPPIGLAEPPVISLGMAHIKVTEETVSQALMTQAAIKALGPDKINFRILQMIWGWDKLRITNMIYHAIRLGYHPVEWKKAQGILLQKGGKRDFGFVRSYRVISLLNCMGKVVENVVAKELS